MDALVLTYTGRKRADAEAVVTDDTPDAEIVEYSYGAGPPATTRILYALPATKPAEDAKSRLGSRLPIGVTLDAAVAPKYRDDVKDDGDVKGVKGRTP